MVAGLQTVNISSVPLIIFISLPARKGSASSSIFPLSWSVLPGGAQDNYFSPPRRCFTARWVSV
ncbi:MAG: hypothetical protein U5N58_06055 [Actinomycetota bacterium]|nr:hypothetical protein [Actinomycetota bacterium]